MNMVIGGGTGFIGRHLSLHLVQHGHSVTLLSRYPDQHRVGDSRNLRILEWDGQTQGAWTPACEGAEAIMNLSGSPIADARWTEARKEQLLMSRLHSTRALLEAISSWKEKPHTCISASGIGFYGDRGEETVHESSEPGTGFLSTFCQAWESAVIEGEASGLRVIPVRIGMVLGRDGGALSKMTTPFRMFLGGPILPGTQYVSWIHQEDLSKLFLWLLTEQSVSGPINGVAPHPVTMKEFCTLLGKAMKRPSWFPVPGFILHILLGELASMLTTGQRVLPQRALEKGFTFTYPTLKSAFHSLFAADSSQKGD